jgi:hypothetical protein
VKLYTQVARKVVTGRRQRRDRNLFRPTAEANRKCTSTLKKTREHVPPKHWYSHARLHYVTTQKDRI